MKPLAVSDAETMCLALQDEIRRSDESRYDHRLHGVLLVAQGMSCPDVARLLGDSARSVQYWVHRFEAEGFGGLAEGERPGRPSRLSDEQLADISAVLREPPSSVDMTAAVKRFRNRMHFVTGVAQAMGRDGASKCDG